ncbi:hypothetical protein HN011_008488 [Eciton burchellii]|nr:hypothetical protein HN011_008488 [Eciton burchellii]
MAAATVRASSLVDTVLETADLLASRKQTREPRIVLTSNANKQRAGIRPAKPTTENCQISARFLVAVWLRVTPISAKYTIKKSVRDTKAKYAALYKKTSVVRRCVRREKEKR